MDARPVPLGVLVASIGHSLADAQQGIDSRVLEHVAAIYDQGVAALAHLRAIGYQPTWYQITEATAEIALSLTVERTGDVASSPAGRAVRAVPVDASYKSRFTYSRTATSTLKFRIVPVPPPSSLPASRSR